MGIFDGIKNTKGKRKSITISLDSEMFNLIDTLAGLLGVRRALIAKRIVDSQRNMITKEIEREKQNSKQNAGIGE